MIKKRVIILQRVCTSYRVPLFQKLSDDYEIDIKVVYGDDIPNSKVKNSPIIDGFKSKKLQTKFFIFKDRTFVFHKKLIRELFEYKPDVIICEGESNFLNYLQALIFSKIFHNKTRIIQWTLGEMPKSEPRPFYLMPLKKFFRKRFNGFIVYSSFGKQALVQQGLKPESIFVAVNVSNTEEHIEKSKSFSESIVPSNNEQHLKCLFVGSIEKPKRLELLIDAARLLDGKDIKFTIVGDGIELQKLQDKVNILKLKNLEFVGRVTTRLPELYLNSDILVLPGRGGMVISEAMCYGLPVLAIAADGTESDLVLPNKTGVLLSNQTGQAIAQALLEISCKRDDLKVWGGNGVKLIKDHFNNETMCKEILRCVHWVTSI